MVNDATHGLSGGNSASVDRSCPSCGGIPKTAVYRSGNGFYVGSWCRCGPYSRESAYYQTREDAEVALPTGAHCRP